VKYYQNLCSGGFHVPKSYKYFGAFGVGCFYIAYSSNSTISGNRINFNGWRMYMLVF